MEKISKIVPSNSRIEAVDLTKNKSGRTQLPGLNQPEASGSTRLPGAHLSAVDRIKFTEEYKMLKPNEARHMEIVQKAQDNFFKVYDKSGQVNKPEISAADENLKMSDVADDQDHEIDENLNSTEDSTSDLDPSINNKTISLYA